MRSFLYFGLLIVLAQFISCSPAVKRSEIGPADSKGQASEKFFPGFWFPPPPPPFGWAHPFHSWGWHPRFYRPYAWLKNEHQNSKRSEIKSADEKSAEKWFLPPPPPFDYWGPFGYLKDSHQNEKRSDVNPSRVKSEEKGFFPPPPPLGDDLDFFKDNEKNQEKSA